MTLRQYFENTTGRGVLATADEKGSVDVAVYTRPHFLDEETVAFIMLDRLTHSNTKSNPHAAYLFMESGDKYVGKRLFLTKIKEETDPELIESMRRKRYYLPEDEQKKARFLVYFHIDKVLPLIGATE